MVSLFYSCLLVKYDCCFILKVDWMFYANSVSDLLSGAICSVKLDMTLKRLLSKIDLLQSHSAVEWGAAAGTLLKCAVALLVGSLSLIRVAATSTGGCGAAVQHH